MDRKFFPLLWLFITVLFIRSLVPAGFMPDFSGKHILTICSGMSTSTIIVDENNQPIPENSPHHPDQASFTDFCPFSFLSAAISMHPQAGLALLIPPLAASEGMVAFMLATILPLSLQSNQYSRAPPLFP